MLSDFNFEAGCKILLPFIAGKDQDRGQDRDMVGAEGRTLGIVEARALGRDKAEGKV